MSAKQPRLTWRQQPRPSGLAGVVAAGHFRAIELRRGSERLAIVDYDRRRAVYYWYSAGAPWSYNSLWDGTTFADVDTAKNAAKTYTLARLAE